MEASTSKPVRGKRKIYLEPNACCELPRTTKWHAKAASRPEESAELLADGSASPTPVEPDEPSQTSSESAGCFHASSEPQDGHRDATSSDDSDNFDVDGEAACDSANMCSGEVPEDEWSMLSRTTLPNSVLTVAEALLSILTFCVTAGLNWNQLEDLIKLVNLLLGDSIIPCSRHLLRKMWDTSSTVRHHFFLFSVQDLCREASGPRCHLQ